MKGNQEKTCSPGESLEAFDQNLGSGSAFSVLISMCKWRPHGGQSAASYAYEWSLAIQSAVMDIQQKILYADLLSVS